MATSQSNIVCDSSTLTNFKAWAQAISTAFSTFGWTQSSDTGQVNWSSIAVIPTGSTWAYEIWQPGDALTTFYVKVEYGNNGTTNSPTLRVSIGTGTNGSGTLSGFTMGPYRTAYDTFTAPSSSTQYECSFSGSTARFGAMLWRNGTNNCQQFLGIERSVDSSGAYTNTHVTLYLSGVASWNNAMTTQRTLVLAVGAAPFVASTNLQDGNGAGSGFAVRAIRDSITTSTSFNGAQGFDTPAPFVGYWDYPSTVVGVALSGDITEGIAFSVTLYSATRTYLPSKNGSFLYTSDGRLGMSALCMRYD